MITVSKPRITTSGDQIRIASTVKIDRGEKELWFDVRGEADFLKQLTPTAESMLLAMLFPAMDRNEPLHLDCEVEDEFLHRVNSHILPLLYAFYPAFGHSTVTAARTRPSAKTDRKSGAVTGMSLGVDSLDTLQVYSGNDVPEAAKLAALAVFNVGAFTEPQGSEAQQRYANILERAGSVAQRSGLKLFGIESNMGDFFTKTNFQRSVTIRNAACGHILSALYGTYHISSAVEMGVLQITADRVRGLDEIDLALVPLLSTEAMHMDSAGAGKSRMDKVRTILDESPFYGDLDTCTRSLKKRRLGQNCGTCSKCTQFLLVAEADGDLDRFKNNFDLAAYDRRKWRAIQRVHSQAYADGRENNPTRVVAYIKGKPVKMPVTAKWAGIAYAMLHRIAPAIFKVNHML